MTNITRRTALRGATAAIAAASLPVAVKAAQEPSSPLPDVTTRLGAAMDEVSACLREWDPNFRAIIGAGHRDYWLQNVDLIVPRTTDQLIDAWFAEHDHLQDITRRLKAARSQEAIDHLSNLRMFHAAPAENEARNAVLRALLSNRRASA